ncbi:putative bifunctional dTTP/UTP pyrophosphatase/methyltransferase protein [Herpailurus yagouaroundi]|uniref:putative bifunctional dTTP/UTP pyrophosphatase/methyltransferase protein n=1 Tax=Herpailurus yagouaroundi TaxID=1608482 RepID=UPI001AD72ADC|nr:probable bifunctional dTTP/UTP pyrophosphatase/methyltransferase protein [Puma yagouaroundi]
MVLSPVIGKLLHKRVVLASASPRRREILSQAGLRFEVVPSRFKEKLDKAAFPTPYAYAIETAKQKALEVASRMHQKDLRAPDVVIGADTIVTIGGLILEKPADKQDAYRMLSRLNGKEHSVFTGVAIIHCCSEDGQLDTDVCEFHEETTVKFSELSEDLLWEYIDSGEPMDKAGGYGIQALGGMLVECVHGDFLNVVGFPLNHFCKKLVELYCPPRREDVQRVKHESIPPVDTFEIASDAAQGDEGCGPSRAGVDGHTGQAPAGPQGPDTNGLVENPPPFPSDLLDLIDGFKASKALFTACKLKVFDVLKEEGPLKAVDVARKINASVCGTGRLLDVCVALGLLEKTDTGKGTCEPCGAPYPQNPRVAPQPVRRLPWAPVCVSSNPVLFQSRDRRLRFMRAMHGLAQLTARQVATAFDLSRFTSACDLGGCTGALARELAREYPRLKVTVFDLPEVIEHVSSFHPEGRQPERLRFVPGDFFKDDLPDAQLYVLSRILHDWADDRVHELLSRVSRSCKPGGGLLVVETALDERRAARASLPAALNALVRAQGRERSLAEYRSLLGQHGFWDVQVAQAGDRLDVVLGTRASSAP